MACYYPIDAWRSKFKNPSGKRPLVFKEADAISPFAALQIPCGRCIGCRLEYSRQWAIRCVHEASLYDANCFITLTYAPEHLPEGGTLVKRDFQLFMKKLRKRFPGSKIRFYHCGEYGEREGRPHYHACLFNFDFPDKIFWKNQNGQPLYISPILDSIWGKGFSSIGSVTFESAAYVARYILKKQTGEQSFLHYADIDQDTGEVLFVRDKEYTTMSRKPGIGKPWLDKYMTDVFPSDSVVMRGKLMKPPRFYDSHFEVLEPEMMDAVKRLRKRNAKKHSADNTRDRLKVRETVLKSKLKLLPRTVG